MLDGTTSVADTTGTHGIGERRGPGSSILATLATMHIHDQGRPLGDGMGTTRLRTTRPVGQERIIRRASGTPAPIRPGMGVPRSRARSSTRLGTGGGYPAV